MKKLIFFLSFTIIFTACNTVVKSKELKVLGNSDSSELTFILELNTKNNSRVDVEAFTQDLSNFIVEREPSSVYGYFISENGKKVTLIERYNNSEPKANVSSQDGTKSLFQEYAEKAEQRGEGIDNFGKSM